MNLGQLSVQWSDWSKLLDIPLIPVAGPNNGQILSQPPQELIDLVLKALNVSSNDDFNSFTPPM